MLIATVTTSPVTCPACGEPASDDTVLCEACGARIKPRKRGAAAGVRIDHDRLDAIPDLEIPGQRGRWGKASDAPTPEGEQDDSEEARAGVTRARNDDDVGPITNPEQERPVALSEAVTVVAQGGDDTSPESPRVTSERRSPSEAPPGAEPPAAHASANEPEPAAAPVDSGSSASSPFQPPLDAEVVVLYPTTAAPEPAPAVLRPPSEPRVPLRPPVLASEALLRDLAPAEPAAEALRIAGCALGAAGLAVVALTIGGRGIGVPLSVLFLALLLLGVPRMPYAARATAVVAVAGAGLALVLWTEELARSTDLDTLARGGAVLLLATGLLLRGWHRSSGLARLLVALGVGLGTLCLAMNDELRHLTMFDMEWQSWAPRLSAVTFGLLLTLSLLAFMDSRTTAGCLAWGTATLGYYACASALELALASWPKNAPLAHVRASAEIALSWLCAPLFMTAFALGLAQVLANGIARTSAPNPRALRPT